MSSRWAAVLAGLVASLICWINGVRPTGHAVIDLILLPLMIVPVVVIGRRAPAPVLIGAAVVNLVALDPLLAALLGLPLLAVIVWKVHNTDRFATVRAVALAAILAVLSFAGSRWPFGWTTAAGVLISLVTVVTAWPLVGTETRRLLWRWGRRSAIFVGVAAALLAFAGWRSNSALQQGQRDASAAADALSAGDFDGTKQHFSDGVASVRAASNRIRRPWTWPAMLVPGLAQQRNAVAGIVHSSAIAATQAEHQVADIDVSKLSIAGGRIDIDAIRQLQEPAQQAVRITNEFRASLAKTHTAWLLPPLRSRLYQADSQAERGAEAADLGSEALQQLPAMLGADGPRVYFVMFTTPAEARGQGGFMASYTTVTIDNGVIKIGAVGRTDDLNNAGIDGRTVTGPQAFLDLYGRYGFLDPQTGVSTMWPWSNITIAANFPDTAQVVAELYPQSGGTEIDGVVSLDVFALQAIIDVVGPVQVPGYDEPLGGDNLAHFLLFDQYDAERPERLDALQLIATQAVGKVMLGGVNPVKLVRALVPMAEQKRVLVWSDRPEEEQMLVDAHVDGGLFSQIDVHNQLGLALRSINANGNKIDSFLERQICVARTGDESPQQAKVTVINHAPTTGYPFYVIGNVIGQPVGSNRVIMSFHSTVPISKIQLNGEDLGIVTGIEADAFVYRVWFDIPSESSVDLFITFDPSPQTGPIFIDPQPLVEPESWQIVANLDDCTPPGIRFDQPGELGG